MEYLAYGDLLGYLRKSRGIDDKYHCGEGEAVELGTYDMVSFAKQIATGMRFLASRGVCEQFKTCTSMKHFCTFDVFFTLSVDAHTKNIQSNKSRLKFVSHLTNIIQC